MIGRLVRQLAVPAPARFEGSFDVGQAMGAYCAKQADLGSPLPGQWVQLAIDSLADLVGSMSRALVPSDLHSGNVLAGSREPWLAIDPRPVVGDPEMSIADFLLDRLPADAAPEDVDSLVRTMVTVGQLDPRRARQWTVVRSVAHWLWCCDVDSGLSPGAPRCSVCAPRCTRIIEALI